MRSDWVLCLLTAAGLANAEIFPLNDSAPTREKLSASVAYVLSLTDDQVRDMTPVAGGGVYFTSCPNCNYGAEEAGCFQSTWDPRQPGRIVCKGCGEVFPDNPRYPDNRFIEVAAPAGRVHRLYYFERADGYRFWFRAHADYWAREYLEARAAELGDLYRLTHDDRYARRAALILDRFAQVFPGYVYKFDYPFKQKLFVPYTQNRVPAAPPDYRTSRWTWWAYMDISLGLLRAYEGIQDWPGWAQFGDGKARERIENDLFIPMVEFVLGYRDDGSNMSMTIWRGAIIAGRVLHRPPWVHEAVRRYEKLLATRFLYDGHWMETCDSYAHQTQDSLRVVMDAAQGYSDPAGYKDAVDERHFDDLNLRRMALGYDAAEQAITSACLPDNRLLPLNDTWAVRGKTQYWRGGKESPRECSVSALLPATGLAVLAGGSGNRQVQAWLDYTMGRHHKHWDALSIGLWANGTELLSDIGYTWTNYRIYWASSTMAHNTVVVNGVNSGLDGRHTGHRLRAFLTDVRGFHMASVDAPSAYPSVVSRYRRTLALVGADSADAYLIDVFQVEGGKQHDYLLHGCRDADCVAAVTGADMAPFTGSLLNPGVDFSLPQSFQHPNPAGFGFGFIGNLRSGPVRGPLTLDFRLAAQPQLGTRTTMTALDDATLFLGDAPDVRRAAEINGDLEKFKAPVFCIRRKGVALRTTFIATHEPISGPPKVLGLTAVQSDGALFLRVGRGPAVADWFVLALDDYASASFSTAHGSLQFKGCAGLLRLDAAGRASAGWLLGGQRLALGETVLSGSDGWKGRLVAFSRRSAREGARGSFDVDQRIAGDRFGPLMVRFPDNTVWPFNIVAVESLPGGTRVHVKEDPAFEFADGRTCLTAYPQRDISGTRLEFELMQVVSWAPAKDK